MKRRKYKRFRARENAFAVLTDHDRKLGQIIDISRGGLAFHYIANGGPSNESSELDIFAPEIGFHLGKIPTRIISDLEIPNEIPFSSITMRRCGVAFGERMGNQIFQLKQP